jgi:hypothetical protein
MRRRAAESSGRHKQVGTWGARYLSSLSLCISQGSKKRDAVCDMSAELVTGC